MSREKRPHSLRSGVGGAGNRHARPTERITSLQSGSAAAACIALGIALPTLAQAQSSPQPTPAGSTLQAPLPPITVEAKQTPRLKARPKQAARPVRAAPPPVVSQPPVVQPAAVVDAGPAPGTSTVSNATPGAYKVDALTGTRFPQPIVDTPKSVQVVPGTIIREQSAQTFNDVLRNVPGITLQAGEGNPPGGNQLKIRGFSATGDLYVDGVRDSAFFFRDAFNTEGVEVVKGPSSAEFGRGSSGGAVNIVTKQAKAGNFTEVEGTIGTGKDIAAPIKRTTVDANYMIPGIDGAVRMVGLFHDGGVPGRSIVEQQRLGFAPSITLGLRSATTFNLSYQWYSLEGNPDAGIPLVRNPGLPISGRVAPVDFSNWYGYLNRDYMDYEQHLVTASLRHRFSESFALQTRLRYSNVHNDSLASSPRLIVSGGAVTGINSQTKPRDQVDEALISQTDATVKLNTFGARHTIVAGVELARENAENRRRLDTFGPNLTAGNPFGPPNNSLVANQADYNGTRARIETETVGVYIRDSVKLGEQWILNGGIRFDHINTRVQGFSDFGVPYGTNTINGRSTRSGERTDDEISWNTGIVYKPMPWGSIYATYGTSFDPVGSLGAAEPGNYQLAGGNNNGPVEAGFFVAPQRSETFEVGTKWDLLGGRLAVNGALFQINRENVRAVTTIGPTTIVSIDGEQRVEGAELGFSGNLSPVWRIFGGYTYLQSEILQSSDRARPVGSEVDNIPRHSFSLWTSYKLPFGVEVAGGATYVDQRTTLGAVNNAGVLTAVPVTVDSYWRFDAAASYAFNETWSMKLNLRNLADKRYIESLQAGGGQGVPGEGFSALLSLKMRLSPQEASLK